VKKKVEDQLLMMAFGDLSAEEVAKVQAQASVDPEAARTLHAYSRMKEELKLLSDVPPDQLSTERLREAILARGLREPRPVSRPTWLWMPAVAAVAAFALVVVKGNLQHPAPMMTALVDKTDGKSLPGMDPIKIVTPAPTVSHSNVVNPPSITKESGSTVVAYLEPGQNRHVRRSRYDALASRGSEPVASTSGSIIGNASAEGLSSMDASAPSAASASLTSFDGNSKMDSDPNREAPADSKPGLVVIQSETDSQMGTHKATEVANSANVVVGG